MGDRDALLYFQRATDFFEEAGAYHTTADKESAIRAIKDGIFRLALGLRLVTTSKGKTILEESLEFWTSQLAELQGE